MATLVLDLPFQSTRSTNPAQVQRTAPQLRGEQEQILQKPIADMKMRWEDYNKREYLLVSSKEYVDYNPIPPYRVFKAKARYRLAGTARPKYYPTDEA